MEPELRPTRTLPAHGGPVGQGRLRSAPEDFRVFEHLSFPPDGAGHHLLLRIRKRGRTTHEAMDAIAGRLGIPAREVGHAGLKDRHAVTEQWLSVHHPAEADLAPGPVAEGIEVLAVHRHGRKLRTGALGGNRFELVIRDLDAAPAALGRRLLVIARYGVPNYFGPQRFGRGGANVDKVLAWFDGRLRVRDRRVRSLLLSAARSELFNRVLAERVRRGCWDSPLAGDLMVLDGRGSLFPAADEQPERLGRRLALMGIHPTGPLPGVAGPATTGEAALLETELVQDDDPLLAGLRRQRVKAMRRALRLRVADLHWRMPEPGVLELGFSLPAGAYATTVVSEIVDILPNETQRHEGHREPRGEIGGSA